MVFNEKLITSEVNSYHKVQLKSTRHIIKKTVQFRLNKSVHEQLPLQNLQNTLIEGAIRHDGQAVCRYISFQSMKQVPSHEYGDEMMAV